MGKNLNILDITLRLKESIFEHAKEVAKERTYPAALALGVRLDEGSVWLCCETLNTEDSKLYKLAVEKIEKLFSPQLQREDYDIVVRGHYYTFGTIFGFSRIEDTYVGVVYFEDSSRDILEIHKIEHDILEKFFRPEESLN